MNADDLEVLMDVAARLGPSGHSGLAVAFAALPDTDNDRKVRDAMDSMRSDSVGGA